MILKYIINGSIILAVGIVATGLTLFVNTPSVTNMLIALGGVVGVVVSTLIRFVVLVMDDLFDTENILEIEEEGDLYSSIEGFGTEHGDGEF